MGSNSGWFKLHRKLQHSEIFNDPDLLRLWMFCLMKASHSERVIEWEGEEITLQPGEFITGRSALHHDYNKELSKKNQVKDTTLWNWLKKIEKMGSLKIESLPSRKASLITLTNWDEHQTEDEQGSSAADNEVKGKENGEETEEMSKFKEAGESEELAIIPKKEVKKGAKKKGRIYDKSDIEYNLASRLFYWMLQNNPKAKEPNPQKWADMIRLTIERDKRTPEDIKTLIDWSQNHSFWKTNILSPDKLRKQFDRLWIQMVEERKKVEQPRGGGSRGEKKNNLLKELMEKEERANGQAGNNQAFLTYN